MEENVLDQKIEGIRNFVTFKKCIYIEAFQKNIKYFKLKLEKLENLKNKNEIK